MTSKPLPFFSYRLPEHDQRSDDFILFHRHRSVWIKVNHTAAEIAALLAVDGLAKSATTHLQHKYRISEEVASRDVRFIRNKLEQYGFLVSGSEPAATPLPRPETVFFHLTSRCNLSCVHCYVSDAQHPKRAQLPGSLVRRIIDELKSLDGASIVLSGGEPLLHQELWEIIQYASGKVGVQLLTNGTLIDQKWAEFLSHMRVRVQISIDGSKDAIHDQVRGKGSFNRALQGLKYLQAAGIGTRINFSTTVMNQNLDDLPNIISLARSLDVPLVRFLPLRKRGSARDTWETTGAGLSKRKQEQFYDYTRGLHTDNEGNFKINCGLSGLLLSMPEGFRKNDIWCSVGKQVVIYANGDAYPCPLLMDSQFCMGNVFHDSLEKIVQSDGMAAVCRALVERREKIEKCAACTWRNLCQAGCMGQALDNKGTIWDTDDFCDYRKRAYKEAFDRILRL
jgi:AdoMet-dependent heme synthase